MKKLDTTLDTTQVQVAWNCRHEIRQYLSDAERWRELREFNDFIKFIEAVIYSG